MPAKPAPKKNLSALKRDRQAEKRRLRNQAGRTAVKTAIKKFETTLASKDRESIEKAVKSTVKLVSSAATKGVIHRNTAARKISRAMKKAHAVTKQSA